ncbi:hypothetical protein [Budvicia diplopodorum]|uniref:hypothetical protein n=1 Tax=Budvicia diplopodorum TaxID=1119056 RepID=UPI0013591F48|nr:hypothetical protein [Budvicia diplopodorum]
MANRFRNSLIGLLCLSMVGCAGMSDEDMGTAGIVVVGLGALAAVLLLSDDDDDDKHKGHGSRDGRKGGHGKGHDRGRGHSERR